MKNLNKKIGAVALAGMVVFGGFAASGAQAFANSFGPYGQLELALEGKADISKKMKEDMEELEAKIESLGYKVLISYKNEDLLKSDAQKMYPHSERFLKKSIDFNKLSKRGEDYFRNYLSYRKAPVSIIKFKGEYHFIKKFK